mgnify:CR=1 FL=1
MVSFFTISKRRRVDLPRTLVGRLSTGDCCLRSACWYLRQRESYLSRFFADIPEMRPMWKRVWIV